MTKAEEVFSRTEALVESGMTKAEAFKKLAAEYGQPVNSIRGSYYNARIAKQGPNGPRQRRRRETTPEDAVADAKATLERAIESIDDEVVVARDRAEEAKREYDALKASASKRKEAIASRIEALS